VTVERQRCEDRGSDGAKGGAEGVSPLPTRKMVWEDKTPCKYYAYVHFQFVATSARDLTLLAGHREEHLTCRNGVICLQKSENDMYGEGPDNVAATPSSLAFLKLRMVYVSGASVSRMS